MAVVNHKYGYIFLHEPHTGGRAMEAALMSHEGSHNCNGNHHATLKDIICNEYATREQCAEYKLFRVIRHPLDWLTTAWVTHTKRRVPFVVWVFTDGKFQMQDTPMHEYKTLFWRHAWPTVRKLRYETLQMELLDVLQCVGAPPVYLEKIGVTKDKPNWRDLLTVQQAQQLRNIYTDFDLHRYDLLG